MCKYEVTEHTSPAFVFYNLVFNAPSNQVIDIDYVVKGLSKYGKRLDETFISDYLDEWYQEGRLNTRGSGYVLA